MYTARKRKSTMQNFKSFLEEVLKLYPAGKIVMILDNARIMLNCLNPY